MEVLGRRTWDKVPASPIKTGYWGKNDSRTKGTAMRECYHWQDEIKVGEFIVAVSVLIGNSTTKYVDPDLGIYLAKDWVD